MGRLSSIALPRGETLIASLPVRRVPLVWGFNFLSLGMSGESCSERPGVDLNKPHACWNRVTLK